MRLLVTLLPLALAGFTTARYCQDLVIPVAISSRQGIFEPVPVKCNIDIASFVAKFNRIGVNYTQELLLGYQTLEGSYNISARYCKPHHGSSDTIQLLSHGIGFDKTYWDLDFDNYAYSYVNNAVEAGYSTLAIDRLGIGLSSHGDPINEIQAQSEVEALNAVTLLLRNGQIPGISRSYKKVVHVGHSFGSVQTFWLSSLYPNNTDGIILTGFGGDSQYLSYVIAGWNLHSARLNQPLRLGNALRHGVRGEVVKGIVESFKVAFKVSGTHPVSDELRNMLETTEVMDLINGYDKTDVPYNYPSGYIASSDLTSLQYAFLYPDNYNISLAVAAEKTKHPLTIGELLTIGSGPKSSGFTGPVLVVTGENDVPFCGGNCYAGIDGTGLSNLPEGVKQAFPSASAFKSHIQPMTGHGNNFHFNATAGYKVMQNFLADNGLAAR